MRALLCLIGLLIASSAFAIDPLPFADKDQEDRFRVLVAELRCVQCQNQNLADSDALIAKDLRKEIFEQMQAGRSDDEIVAFLVERYGDFVLYEPPFNAATGLLWVGPFALLLGGGLTALQAMAVSTGFPFTIVLLLACYSILRGLASEPR